MKNIFLTGHNGMVGQALYRCLNSKDHNLITKNRSDLDLCNQADVQKFFKENNVDQVYIASARVGGILENQTYMADFTYSNAIMELNIIQSAFESGVKDLLFLGSSCIYPKFAEIPIKENQLLSGYLEKTNEGYAIAKILGIKLCEYLRKENSDLNYKSVIPTNLYGLYDNFNITSGHVLPSLLHKFYLAKEAKKNEVVVWGDGTPTREFLNVDDLADACELVLNTDGKDYWYNIGSGIEITIKDLAYTIKDIVGFKGEVVFDTKKPNGTPRKLIDSSKIKKIGWKPKIQLIDGIKDTYIWFLENYHQLKK